MRIKSSKETYTLRQQLLASEYGKLREAWTDAEKYRDDRRVFCNVYDQLMDACDVMKAVENTFIRVAFDEKYREDEQMLGEIKSRFSGREV